MPVSEAARDPQTVELRRRQTAEARRVFNQKFPTPESKSAHYRAVGQAAHARRRVLSGDDVAALAEAYRTLDAIVKKYRVVDGAARDGP
jgi:hypothetical protein